MKVTYEQWEELSNQITERKRLIWAMIDTLNNKRYSNPWEQYNSMRTLGRLAEKQQQDITRLNRMEVFS